MANERLRSSMRRTGTTPDELARLTGTDIKTVYRWVSPGRPPLRATGHSSLAISATTRNGYGLKSLRRGGRPERRRSAEVVAAYPYRSDAPTSLWWNLFSRAQREIDLLGYTLYFLSLQHPELVSTLQEKCSKAEGSAIIGDADSEHVQYRDREEATPLTLAVRIQTTLSAWAPLMECPGFQLRYQDIRYTTVSSDSMTRC